jgi:serine protease
MRAARWIAAAGAAVTVAAVVTVTTNGTTTAVEQPAKNWPVVPASAGTLAFHEGDYLWPKGHKETEHETNAAAAAAADPGNNLIYGGGAAPGAISQTPAVYLVFWGSQWSKTDPVTTYLQRFFNGLYGPGDDWTTVTREFCEGVPTGAVTCTAGVPHVGGPSGPLLKGVWFDDALPAVPATAGVLNVPSVDQMGAEAVRAAAHFGNTTAAKNTQSQYVVALPSGFLAPGEGYYCAYHSAVTSNYGSVAYTNLPYLNDVGALCGQNSVNAGAAGTYDGYSIVEGHEYLETITDMRPRTGWTDSGGQENADKCAWISSGQGAMGNLTLSTGTFAVQSTWSNAFNGGAGGCVLHAG